MKDCVILGMLTQMKEGEWWLEDPTGAIKLNISDASFHKGIFVESSLVLAEGLIFILETLSDNKVF